MSGFVCFASVRAFCAFLAVGTAVLLLACSDSDPVVPDTSLYAPVQEAAQLDGRWETENILAAGLPLSSLLVPGAIPGQADSRLSAFLGDLAVTTSGEHTGLFSADARGTARDTAEALPAASGSHLAAGSFTLWGEGQIQVRLSAENGHALDRAQNYLGQASILADTLLLEFNLLVPPHKAVPFLPSSLTVLARMVRR
jgi:hypothetical protein